MAVYTYEDVTPPIIANTIMRKRFIDGVFKVYTIKPVDGYVLHDNTLDYEAIDPVVGGPLFDENGEVVMLEGYASGEKTCAANYDFVANPRGFYAKLESEVPADQIFGGGGSNNHEVM